MDRDDEFLYVGSDILLTSEEAEGTEGVILGQMDSEGERLLTAYPAQEWAGASGLQLAVIGAAGSGKLDSFIMPACQQAVLRGESVVITDPDGRLYGAVSEYFRINGYTVRRFNVGDAQNSDSWNCLSSIQGAHAEYNAGVFSSVLAANIPTDIDRNVFEPAATELVTALILRVALGDDFGEEEKTLPAIFDILALCGNPDLLDDFLLRDRSSDQLWSKHYENFQKFDWEIRSHALEGLVRGLIQLRDVEAGWILSQDGIDLTLPGKERCAYFCELPPTKSNRDFIQPLFLAMLATSLSQYSDDMRGDSIPVNFLLAEFPFAGRIPDWHRWMVTFSRRNISSTIILRSAEHLVEAHPTNWGQILGNCSAMLFLGDGANPAAMVFVPERHSIFADEDDIEWVFSGLWEDDWSFVWPSGKGKFILCRKYSAR